MKFYSENLFSFFCFHCLHEMMNLIFFFNIATEFQIFNNRFIVNIFIWMVIIFAKFLCRLNW